LRTPVSSVLGHSELLLEEVVDSPEQQRTYLKRIHAKMLGFNRLIQDLFELARIESQSDRFRMACLPLAPLIEKVYEKYLSDVQNAGIRFSCDITVAPDISVSVDEDRLDQVFANLIANATRYVSKQGSIRIHCSLTDHGQEGEPLPGGKSMALLSVSDDGPGIPPEHVANIFERFYRANKSQNASSEHSGLGLAISKEIILAHGGQIWVDEAAKQGCTISFTLPILS
jgi:signal transduction histidine kinase